jgi:hypothetical protein
MSVNEMLSCLEMAGLERGKAANLPEPAPKPSHVEFVLALTGSD